VDVLGETEGDLKNILDIIAAWCNKWRLSAKPMKKKTVQFMQNQEEALFIFLFHLGDTTLSFAHDYNT